MASITSLSNSSYNTSSIYGNRNVLSGLASGMDTESMIENAVSGIKLKIQNLQKKRTKVEWQQEAYRSIIDKAVNFSNKYTSYSSKTNLLSSSFFNNAVNTQTLGTYADKVTASGKTSSDIKINGVKQMATAASYAVSGLGGMFRGEFASVDAAKGFDIAGTIPVNNLSGTLTFQYGGTNGTTFDIKFDELENLDDVEVLNADGTVKTDATNAEKLAQAINNKLSEVTYNYTKNGFQESTTADKAVKVTANADGRLSFSDGLGNGNTVKISSSTGKIKAYAGENVLTAPNPMMKDTPLKEYLSDKELGITYNGTTKKISMSKVLENIGNGGNDDFVAALNKELDSAFGSGKVSASMNGGKLSLSPSGQGDTLVLGGSAVEALGFSSGDSNYINASKTLTDLLGKDNELFTNNRLRGTFNNIDGKPTEKTNGSGDKYYVDDKGNRVDKDGFRITDDGKAMYDFKINGTSIAVNEDTTLESLINSINSNAEAGVKVSYSKLTNEFKFTATETGAASRIEFDGLAKSLFGDTDATASAVDTSAKIDGLLGSDYDYGTEYANFSMDVEGLGSLVVHADQNSSIDDIVDQFNDMLSVLHDKGETDKAITASFDSATNSLVFKDENGNTLQAAAENGVAKDLLGSVPAPSSGSFTAGQDAVMDVEINGKRFENLTRSSNTFDIDGLNVTVKGTFNEDGKNVDADGKEIDPITFNTTTDSDKIVEAIASMINDYNEMVTEIKNAYSTTPAQKSNGARYEPLTAEEEDSYSESELKAYEEKAKQGILFGDSNLSSMYGKLLNAIQPGGTDGQTLREIGITTSYSNGLTTLTLDEDKLRSALDSDPDKVRNAFTKSTEGGSTTNGLMQTMQNTLNTYVKTTGEPKGVLITRAGSMKAPTSLNSNSLKSQMDSIDNQIERWQDKMSDQIDRYTTKFSKLEQLIAEMNSQSSALMGLMGGGTSY